jgi:hypothetical protein
VPAGARVLLLAFATVDALASLVEHVPGHLDHGQGHDGWSATDAAEGSAHTRSLAAQAVKAVKLAVMSDGMSLSGDGSLEIGPSGRGVFRVQVQTLAEFKAITAYLAPRTLLYVQGRPHVLQLVDPDPPQPAAFPTEFSFAVIESPLREGVALERMILTNPDVQPRCDVEVVEFGEPTEGGADGHLLIWCDTIDVNRAVRERLDGRAAGILMSSQSSGLWGLRWKSDEVALEQPFPQPVRFKVVWALPG